VIRTVQVHSCQELLKDDANLLQTLVVFYVVLYQLGTCQALMSLLIQRAIDEVTFLNVLESEGCILWLVVALVVVKRYVDLEELLFLGHLFFVF